MNGEIVKNIDRGEDNIWFNNDLMVVETIGGYNRIISKKPSSNRYRGKIKTPMSYSDFKRDSNGNLIFSPQTNGQG